MAFSEGRSGECSAGHSPVVFGLKCCPNYRRSATCSKSGALETSDPIECCEGTAVIDGFYIFFVLGLKVAQFR